jgi:tRNA A37 N6-isopentenylltransferase MiaA
MEKYNMVTILGATASGKTGVAVNLALQTGGEIISADSRQVYRGMDLGTGKDLNEYTVDGVEVPYHLIDIVDAGTAWFNVYQFQQHFINAFRQIEQRNRLPILCGGSGMYIEAVLKGYSLINVPPNEALRQQLWVKRSTNWQQYCFHTKNCTIPATLKRSEGLFVPSKLRIITGHIRRKMKISPPLTA